MTSHDDLPFWVALSFSPKVGATTFQRLLARFSRMEDVWNASEATLREGGLDDRTINAVHDARLATSPERAMKQIARFDLGVLTLKDSAYPKLLSEIPDPPGVLFIRGKIEPDDELSLAVVGSRKITPYGRRVTEELVRPLTQEGMTIVSGLALGVDSVAHEIALESGGRTLAVLGCGLDQIYPASHQQLAKRIIEGRGAVISEYPPGTPTYPSNFPVRNRIIAGLSLGVIVVEAALESGSLLTAKSALDYNREVFAVPGPIFSETSAGTNNLLKMGAKPVTSADDILVELSLKKRKKHVKARKVLAESPEEGKLLPLLSTEPVHVDKLIEQSGLSAASVNGALILMEMKGKVKNLGGNFYV
jgi:DNA processing protein